jgi:hypothetical protein
VSVKVVEAEGNEDLTVISDYYAGSSGTRPRSSLARESVASLQH